MSTKRDEIMRAYSYGLKTYDEMVKELRMLNLMDAIGGIYEPR